MGKLYSRTFVWQFDSPPEAIWPVLADTARFNEAAKLPRQTIEETPREDGSVLYIARAKQGPFALEWQEQPVNWVANKWFEHRRFFSKGPLKSLSARFELSPDGDGCRGIYTLEAEAANVLGHLLLRTQFFDAAGKTFGALAEDAAKFARGEAAMPFQFTAPSLPPEAQNRIEDFIQRIEDSGHGHNLVRRLVDFVTTAQDVDLVHIRPLKLARDWRVEDRQAIELCLEAARCGLLDMRWDVLCPRCRIPKAAVATLDKLPGGAHCGTCNVDYDSDFSKNVELSFMPSATIRGTGQGEYCLFGPMSTPHIYIHLTLQPGERRSVPAELAQGAYRLRTLEPGPEVDITWTESGFPEVILGKGGITAGAAVEAGMVTLHNQSDRALTAIVEERHWTRDALTADRVTAMQAFRDLFSEQVLRPGDEVAVKRITLMFSDLRDSTALYADIGDAQAYHLVRDHFAFMAAIVRKHNGAVVKTIGDAIMAAFSDPADGLKAALDVQGQVAAFNDQSNGHPIVIKLGLHEGPAIVVTLNERLDYFGSTVNMAARLQGESSGGDIVISRTIAEDSAVRPLLAQHQVIGAVEEQQTTLKGFAGQVAFLRLRV